MPKAGNGIVDTAAGDPYVVAPENLPAADALLVMAAHISRHDTLTEWMDASVTDEARPLERDPELNLYDPTNPNQPPYSAEFLDTYRAAQHARNRRITAWVQGELAALHAVGEPHAERSSPSPCTAPWPTRDGSTRRSIRAIGSPADAFSVTPAS